MLQYTAYFVLAPLAAITSAGVLFYAWRYHASRQMPALIWMTFSVLGWLACNILDLLTSTEAGTVFWAKMGYVFVMSTTLIWLRFALRYTDRYKWLKSTRFAWFCVVPLLTIFIVFTNELHHWMWAAYTFVPVGNVLAIHILRYGVWFWVNVVHEYFLVFIGAALIIQQALKSYNFYRQQSLWLVAGALIPITGNALYVFRLIPGLVQDYTSVTFAIAAIAFVIGMTRHQLFDLQPVARDAVIDSMSDVMVALDKHDRVVDLNPAALAILGIEVDAILGKHVRQAFAPWQDMVERFKPMFEMQTDIAAEYNHQQRYYDLRIFPLRDRWENITGRIIVVRDITDRKATEVALRERTQELEALNEQLDAFAHTVAHDIKDSLTGVVALSTLITEYFEDLGPAALREYLEAIAQNALRLTSIVDALLLLASVRQLEAINVEPLDMLTIIANAQKRLSVLIAERQAVLVTPETWPLIHSYGPWIEEVWVNYVSNAIKYGGTPPRVEVGYSLLETGSDNRHPVTCFQFWVRDNGSGLTAEEQAQLFTKFTRLGNTGPGYGLGLSIARNIVEKLGGEVGVESEVGQGSSFWFTLPVS